MAFAIAARRTFWDVAAESLEARALGQRSRALSESWLPALRDSAEALAREEREGREERACCESVSGESESTAPGSEAWSEDMESDASSVAGPPGSWAASPRPAAGAAAPQAPARRRRKARRQAAEAPRTTLLVRNLPSTTTRDGLRSLLDACGLQGKYDFLHVPTNFRTMSAFGYGFVNFEDATVAESARQTLHGRTLLEQHEELAVLEAIWSQPHQGREAYIERYRNCPVMHESVCDSHKPLLLCRGERVAFPAPTRELVAPAELQA